tara:strand:- start:3522 stop:4325 length:804 start_codon:yes stop_codon:yes gene_type:complete
MFDFFFDTADIDYIRDVWSKLEGTVDRKHVRGITTNPNAFYKIDQNHLAEWEQKLPELCALVTEIRGDDKGIVYVQVPSSELSPEGTLAYARHISQFNDGSTKLGLKIPPYEDILDIVDSLNEIMETNVTGLADAGTALSCLSYGVKYISLIPGRMEEKGLDAKAHVSFTNRRKTDNSEIIAGSMRTLEGLRWVVEYGTVPTIGTRVWALLLADDFNLPDLLDYNNMNLGGDRFAPFNTQVNRQLSLDFFEQMDVCGSVCYKDWAAR